MLFDFMEQLWKKVGLKRLLMNLKRNVLSGLNITSRSAMATALSATVLLAGCGGSGVGGSLTGVFLDAAVEGVKYRTSSKLEGITNAAGEYKYKPGDTVEFFVGDVSLGSAVAQGLLVTTNLPFPLQVAQFLQTLDEDGIPDNGIKIPVSYHTNKLFLKGSAATTGKPSFAKSLDISTFDSSQANQQFIDSVYNPLALVNQPSRKIVSEFVTAQHLIKSTRLKIIEETKPEFYSYIVGSFDQTSANALYPGLSSVGYGFSGIPKSSNVFNKLNSRLEYYYYFKAYEPMLDFYITSNFNNAMGRVANKQDTDQFSSRFLNLSGLTTEITLLTSDLFASGVDREIRRKVVTTVKSSGMSWVEDQIFGKTGGAKDIYNVLGSCTNVIPAIPSLDKGFSEFLKRFVVKNIDKAINCVGGETVKAAGRFGNSILGTGDLKKYYAYKLAKGYLDVSFACGKNSSCMASVLGGRKGTNNQLHYLAGHFNMDPNVRPWAVSNAYQYIDEYKKKIESFVAESLVSLPDAAGSLYQLSDRVNSSGLSIKLNPTQIDVVNNLLWVELTIANKSTFRDLRVNSLKLQLNTGTANYNLTPPLGTSGRGIMEQDIFNKFRPPNDKGSYLIPLPFDPATVPSGSDARLSVTLGFDSKDGVVSDTVQQTKGVLLDVLKASAAVQAIQNSKISLASSFGTVDESKQLILPTVSLGGNAVVSADVYWTASSLIYSSVEYSVLLTGNKWIVTAPKLRNSVQNDYLVLKAYVNTSPDSLPAIFGLNIIKKAIPPAVQAIDGFDYPVGNRGVNANGLPIAFAEQIPSGETNNIYTNESAATTDFVRGTDDSAGILAGVNTSNWRNAQDVGSFNSGAFTQGVHPAEDWNLNTGDFDRGQKVYAIANGTVVSIRPTYQTGPDPAQPDLNRHVKGGWTIVLKHVTTTPAAVHYSFYTHVTDSDQTAGQLETSAANFILKVGDPVTRGDPIARLAAGFPTAGGMTVVNSHLHFEIRTIAPSQLSLLTPWSASLWPSGNGFGYYTHNQSKLTTMSAGLINQTYQFMKSSEGIIDPSDYIDANRAGVVGLVTNISPQNGVVSGQSTLFTITGTSLPSTLALSLNGSTVCGGVTVNPAGTSATVNCTPGTANNAAPFYIKNVTGGIILPGANALTVQVIAAQQDQTPPVITLIGNAVVTVNQGATYTDAGATASDLVDGDLTTSIATNNGVNTSVLGTYQVTYDVSDAANNAAVQVVRTVNVVVNSLVAHYKFDGNALDSSGNGNNGTVFGGVTYTAGAIGQSATFDGISGYIRINHAASLNVSGDYTFSFWVNRSTAGGVQNVITKGRDCLNSYWFRSGGQAFQAAYGNTWCDGVGASALFPLNEWHHVTGIIDNTNGFIRYYLDGALASEQTMAAYSTTNTYPLILGRHFTNANGSGGFTYHFKGSLDDLRIYNRALTAAEIAQLAGSNLNNGLVAHYKFEGNANDSSGNGNNGAATAVTYATGYVGQAGVLNGTNTFIDILHSPELSLTTVSLSLWVKTTSVVGPYGNMFIHKWTEGFYNSWNYGIGVSATGKAYMSFKNATPVVTQPDAVGLTNIIDGQWHHLTGIIVGGSKIELYVDGVLESTTNTNLIPIVNANPIRIGATQDSLNTWRTPNAIIDNVRIYNRALTATEVLALAGGNLTNQAPAPTAPRVITSVGVAGTSQIAANDPNLADTHTYAVSSAAINGTASVDAVGLVTYTPNAGYVGADSFVVTVTDGRGLAGLVTINATVN